MIVLPKNAREEIRIEAGEYQGKPNLSVRVWYQHESGEMRPSRQGITIPRDQGAELAAAIEAEIGGCDG